MMCGVQSNFNWDYENMIETGVVQANEMLIIAPEPKAN